VQSGKQFQKKLSIIMTEVNVLDRVLKDIGDVESRLFNHRPFIQGETKFILKEFEEKRKEREVRRMFEMLEIVTDIKETQIEKGVKLGDMHLCNLTGHFEVALRMCNNIVEREDSNKKKTSLIIEENRGKKNGLLLWMIFKIKTLQLIKHLLTKKNSSKAITAKWKNLCIYLLHNLITVFKEYNL